MGLFILLISNFFRTALVLYVILAAYYYFPPSIAPFATKHPTIDVQIFDGTLQGYGIMQDWSGTVVQRFAVTIEGTWEGERGTVSYTAHGDDGEILKRTLQLTRHNDHHFTVAADDINGVGIGKQQGSAMQLTYDWEAPMGDKKTSVTATETLWMTDATHLVDNIILRKFGLPVGEFTVFITAQHPAPTPHVMPNPVQEDSATDDEL